MASRDTFTGSSTPPVTGPDYMDQIAERIGTLFDASALPLTGVAGTANAVTATLDPPLVPANTFVDGMKFEITWAAENTAGVTLAINGGTALAVLDPAGTALAAGAIGPGLRSLLEYIGGAFRILSPTLISIGGGSPRFYWQFTASGTWTKPGGLDDDAMVFVELWAAGGGGASTNAGGGGGGGGWIGAWFRAGALPASVSVTIGAGGGVGGNGGNTTFGSLLTAFGGLGATATNGARGGSAAAGGRFGAGAEQTDTALNGNDATTENGGGGGGPGPGAGPGRDGGNALRGGGGGGGRGAGGGLGNGGTSVFGGNGGAGNSAGSAPGGGGGRNAAGARGEARVWI
jgi:hypothetical protein